MKVVASAVTWILPSLKWLSLVDCVEDFGQLMKAQVCFVSITFVLTFIISYMFHFFLNKFA
jgi:hypothetical protein